MQFFNSRLKSIQYGLCLLLCAALLASCGEDSKLTRHIPKDASGVLAIDIKSMALKSMDFKEILKLENFRKMFDSSEDSVGKAIRNSGIDLISKGYVFGKATEPGKGYGAAVIGLSDAAAFEAFLKKIDEGVVISDEGGFKVATFRDEQKANVAWNKSELIVVFAEENSKETLLSLANLKKEDAIAGNVSTFDELEKQKADISVWVNYESFMSLVPQTPYSATAGMNFKDTYMMATCNFDDGAIVVDSKYLTNDETTKKFNFFKSNIDGDVVQALPGKNVIALMGFAIDVPKLISYLESENFIATYDPLVQPSTGLTTKQIIEMLDGDAAISVNGAAMKEVSRVNPYTGEELVIQEPEFDMTAVLGIANKETATKLLTHFVDAGMLTKSDNVYSLQNKFFVIDKGDAFVLVNTDARRQSVLAGGGEKLNSDLSGLFKSNCAAMYVNTNNIPADFLKGQNAEVGTHLNNWTLEDITATSTGVKDNVTTGHFIVRFKSKNENSLITLSKIVKTYSQAFTPSYIPPVDEAILEEEAAAGE